MNYKDTVFDLSGRVACVSGGAGLLGREFCRALLDGGARVALLDLDRARAEEAARSIGGGDALRVVAADITDSESVGAAVASIAEAWDDVDVLVNSAAIDPKFDPETQKQRARGGFPDFPLSNWELSLRVNLTGTYLLTQAVCRGLEKKGKGSIINIASMYGICGPNQALYERDDRGPDDPPVYKPADYTVTKAGMVGFTKYLAAYYAGTNIRVNTLTPGGVFNNHDEQFLKRYRERVIMGRMANREEFHGAILFLASDASSYMTGANLVVDGGWSAW